MFLMHFSNCDTLSSDFFEAHCGGSYNLSGICTDTNLRPGMIVDIWTGWLYIVFSSLLNNFLLEAYFLWPEKLLLINGNKIEVWILVLVFFGVCFQNGSII